MNYSIDWDSRGEDDWDDYDGCNHDDYDIDTIEGRCHCHRCGDSWYATDAQIQHAIDAEVAYANWQDEQNRRQWWLDLTFPIRWRLFALVQKVWPRKAKKLISDDDEIPF